MHGRDVRPLGLEAEKPGLVGCGLGLVGFGLEALWPRPRGFWSRGLVASITSLMHGQGVFMVRQA